MDFHENRILIDGEFKVTVALQLKRMGQFQIFRLGVWGNIYIRCRSWCLIW